MLVQLILGFLPWILYSSLAGPSLKQQKIAVIVALLVVLVLDFKELKKGFVLTWGTLLFFILLLAVIFIYPSPWLESHVSLIANCALALIVWFSLVINKPFTLQYAREQISAEYWQSPLFIRINQIITIAWGICFLILVLVNALPLFSVVLSDWLYVILSVLPLLLAVWFTSVFPDWYKERQHR
ncbi:hypothetical protein ACQUW5_14295 [Legionella sp. CNM-1927-20]|uniref:hypothetical protein n=1 Tax=Legionella sp. CNM-1927-20 TaxID=3422221 RepID=UPI00403B0896